MTLLLPSLNPPTWRLSAHPINTGIVCRLIAVPGYNGYGSNQWLDISGNNNHGTLDSMDPELDWQPTNRIGGKGQLDLDGVNDNVDILYSPLIHRAPPVSISIWVKPDVDNGEIVFSNTGGGENLTYWTLVVGDPWTGSWTDELITIGYDDDDRGFSVMSYTTTDRTELYDGNLHNITVTSDGSLWRMYLDGIGPLTLQTAGAGNDGFYGPLVSNPDTTKIGCRRRNDTNDSHYGGSVDDLIIWDRKLDSGEIKQFYEDSLGPNKSLGNVSTFYFAAFEAADGTPFTGTVLFENGYGHDINCNLNRGFSPVVTQEFGVGNEFNISLSAGQEATLQIEYGFGHLEDAILNAGREFSTSFENGVGNEFNTNLNLGKVLATLFENGYGNDLNTNLNLGRSLDAAFENGVGFEITAILVIGGQFIASVLFENGYGQNFTLNLNLGKILTILFENGYGQDFNTNTNLGHILTELFENGYGVDFNTNLSAGRNLSSLFEFGFGHELDATSVFGGFNADTLLELGFGQELSAALIQGHVLTSQIEYGIGVEFLTILDIAPSVLPVQVVTKIGRTVFAAVVQKLKDNLE